MKHAFNTRNSTEFEFGGKRFICISEEGFEMLLDELIKSKSEQQETPLTDWISYDTAMKRLGYKSRTSMSRFLALPTIKTCKVSGKKVLISAKSIEEYLSVRSKTVI
ncbi:MAG TPA: hypothetical protein VFG10_17605 [Saprospiraceae bacterium]|nr:hypothetical protein [Saprospiraceae bacterium]